MRRPKTRCRLLTAVLVALACASIPASAGENAHVVGPWCGFFRTNAGLVPSSACFELSVLATSGSVHTGWMHSEGHRQNVLQPGYDAIGIGVYCAPDGLIWAVENFGRYTSSSRPPYSESSPTLQPLTRPGADGRTCSGEHRVG
jgi:hypothetical protein